jgi:hypothetical protein
VFSAAPGNQRGTKKHHDTIKSMMTASSHVFSSTCLPPAGGRIRSQGNYCLPPAGVLHSQNKVINAPPAAAHKGGGWVYEAYEVKNKS